MPTVALDSLWPWLALVGLGAFHGVNPAMGWLFAVLVGMQERRMSALIRALLPLALGHEASVAIVMLLVGALQVAGAADVVRVAGACGLVLLGAYRLLKPRWHPRWVGMRVSNRELFAWSFLMSTAHGAGLMLFPVVLGLEAARQLDGAAPGPPWSGATFLETVAAAVLHTLALVVIMGSVASIVYARLGLGMLRRAWINVDLLWAVGLVTAGAVTLFT